MQLLMSIMTEGPLFVVCKHSSVEKMNKVYPVLGKKIESAVDSCTMYTTHAKHGVNHHCGSCIPI